MNRTTLIILVIVSLFVVGSIFSIFYFFKPSQQDLKYNYTKYFVVKDENGNLLSSHFYLYDINFNFLRQGDFLPTFNELTLSQNNTFQIFCIKDKYYYGRTLFNPSSNKIVIDLYRFPIYKNQTTITKINLTKNSLNNISFNISSDYQIRRPILCFEWSFGIIDIYNSNYLQYDIPNFLKTKVDKCFFYEKGTIYKNTKTFNFTIETGQLTRDDYINIYIVDQCKDKCNDFKEYIYECGDKDICMPTFKYTIYP